ncbi:hypothetical protein ABZT04_13530 [Streptomyces sp. NPDC005492]|uniref:hypothetical protein n=1 Tax=Streptomyces sp. NPDC005492 TaxID=3156883 RepID=UPI0033A48517
MPHSAISLTKEARTAATSSAVAPGSVRRTPSTTPRVMPLWQAMAHLFAPDESTVRP